MQLEINGTCLMSDPLILGLSIDALKLLYGVKDLSTKIKNYQGLLNHVL